MHTKSKINVAQNLQIPKPIVTDKEERSVSPNFKVRDGIGIRIYVIYQIWSSFMKY